MAIIRWYYLVFERERCFYATIEDRLMYRWDCVSFGDKYIGNHWWLRPNKKK